MTLGKELNLWVGSLFTHMARELACGALLWGPNFAHMPTKFPQRARHDQMLKTCCFLPSAPLWEHPPPQGH